MKAPILMAEKIRSGEIRLGLLPCVMLVPFM